MLELAVQARLPMVTVRLPDPENAYAVVEAITDSKVRAPSPNPRPGFVYVYNGETYDSETLAPAMAEAGATAVIVNPEDEVAHAYDAGELTVPRELIRELLREAACPQRRIRTLTPYLTGLSMREIRQCLQLARECFALTPEGIRLTRRMCFTRARGIQLIETSTPNYIPDTELDRWVERRRADFMDLKADSRMVPRGILFADPPGMGKTLAAKRIAALWKVPLYRLDVGAMKHRWVGDSEKNLRDALRALDAEEPCVALLDEVEKLFTVQDDSGVSTGMLADLLWWMQERTARVFVVMTTNDAASIPPELMRPGRADMVWKRGYLDHAKAMRFGIAYGETLGIDKQEVRIALSGGRAAKGWSRAEVVARLIEYVRDRRG